MIGEKDGRMMSRKGCSSSLENLVHFTAGPTWCAGDTDKSFTWGVNVEIQMHEWQEQRLSESGMTLKVMC